MQLTGKITAVQKLTGSIAIPKEFGGYSAYEKQSYDAGVDSVPLEQVTADAADVLIGKDIVDASGNVVSGTMPNNGAISKTLTANDTSYTVPEGYHDGRGIVQIQMQDKVVTPTKENLPIYPDEGYVTRYVLVKKIPDEYQDVTAVTAGAADVVAGKTIVAADGSVVEGTAVIIPDYLAMRITNTLTEYSSDVSGKITDSAFGNAGSLLNINFPNVTSLGGYCFQNCVGLTEVYFPKVTTVATQAFNGCSNLKKAIFDSLSTLNSSAFRNSALDVLVLKNTSRPCTLTNANAFDGTPFASGGTGGKVLVPAGLISSYQTATNWSTLYGYGTCEFLPLELYTDDGTTTGEINWEAVLA